MKLSVEFPIRRMTNCIHFYRHDDAPIKFRVDVEILNSVKQVDLFVIIHVQGGAGHAKRIGKMTFPRI
jgi:hypothetical protein